jgi:hypothetical protein
MKYTAGYDCMELVYDLFNGGIYFGVFYCQAEIVSFSFYLMTYYMLLRLCLYSIGGGV